ncbi:uncharacterized protein LOC123534418 isoform X4 [Mercenaria mercenaria]|uniref:uncharacterized protein LOC123534418 isoform X4 n=1 Tax=Mercenaria mercenaria TaxID=6596 RepID=UPI00234FA550|nr:uncharacterized protein LOC123534418 isoform X4 [Mercenaria mercenaria]
MDIWKCVSLWILLHICPGIPKTTTIQNDNKIYSVGNNVTLTCISHSTTNPSDPKLNLQYNWKVNNVVNPTDARYIYSQFKQTLIVTKLVKEDANRNFTCTATEYGPTITGLTSASSDGHTINIIYGPDRCNINVQSPYILAEGNTPATITCQSDCFPSCSYKWTNSSTGKVVGFEGEFQLDTLTRYEAGNYTCSCQNTAIIDHRDTTSLQVIVNFASFFITKARQKLLSVRMKLMYTLSVKLTAMQDQKSK